MSEFKGGEDVLFNEIEYVYIAKHPIFTNFSVIQYKHSKITSLPGDIAYVATDDIKKKPKTHTVNGFEVPAPISEADFEVWDVDSTPLYCFLSSYRLGWASLYRDDISAVSVKCGFVFRSESDIKKNIAALQGINPSTVE